MTAASLATAVAGAAAAGGGGDRGCFAAGLAEDPGDVESASAAAVSGDELTGRISVAAVGRGTQTR